MRLLALLPLLVIPALGSANLLVDPTGGTVLTTSDDGQAFPSISNFSFYGTPVASIGAEMNGNLNTIFTNRQQTTVDVPQIAPLADDLYRPQGGSFTGLTTPSYYAFTWKDLATFGDSASLSTFQALLVRADGAVNGIDLRQNDIVFSYGQIGRSFRDGVALIGVSNGSLATANLAPGSDAEGLISRTAAEPFFPTGESYLRYRFNGTTYDRTIVGAGAVPEPATLAGLALGGLALLRRRKASR